MFARLLTKRWKHDKLLSAAFGWGKNHSDPPYNLVISILVISFTSRTVITFSRFSIEQCAERERERATRHKTRASAAFMVSWRSEKKKLKFISDFFVCDFAVSLSLAHVVKCVLQRMRLNLNVSWASHMGRKECCSRVHRRLQFAVYGVDKHWVGDGWFLLLQPRDDDVCEQQQQRHWRVVELHFAAPHIIECRPISVAHARACHRVINGKK